MEMFHVQFRLTTMKQYIISTKEPRKTKLVEDRFFLNLAGREVSCCVRASMWEVMSPKFLYFESPNQKTKEVLNLLIPLHEVLLKL